MDHGSPPPGPGVLGRRRFLVLSAGFLASPVVARGGPASPDAPSGEEWIFLGGSIYPMEDGLPRRVEAVAVRGDRIVHAGTRADALARLGPDPRTFDLKGRTLFPGFVEPHIHHGLAGAFHHMVNIRADDDWRVPGVTCHRALDRVEFTRALVAAEAALEGPSDWLVVEGWASYFHGPIGRPDLERISTTRPIVVFQRSGHEAFLNGAALAAVGFTEERTRGNPDIHLGAGHVREAAVFHDLVPRLLEVLLAGDRWPAALRDGVSYLHGVGVTTSVDMMAIDGFTPAQSRQFHEILDAADVPFRTWMIAEPRVAFERGGAKAALDLVDGLARRDGLRLRYLPHAKAFADGAFFAQLMQMRGGYTDGHAGAWITPPPVLEGMLAPFFERGRPVHVHVNGDAGVDRVLDLIERLSAGRPPTPVTLHHLGVCQPDQVARMRRLGVRASVLPYYVHALGDVYARQGLGPERARRISPAGSLVRGGVVTSIHADFPMAPADPLFGAWVAVNRVGQLSGEVIGPDERLSVHEAMRAITIDSARTVNLDREVGSILPGKVADFTVLEQDPYAVHPMRLREIGVAGTVLGGRWFPAARPGATRRAPGRAIVVGAGISGLTAALDLVRQGIEVELLEAAPREGGRFDSATFDGVAANLGVQWVNPGVSPLVDTFLERIPVQPLGTKDGGFALAWDGKLVDPAGNDFFAALPIPARARKDLGASVVKMRKDAAALYPGVDLDHERSWNHVFDLPTDTPLWRMLESTSMADYLAEFDPAVTTVWGTRVSAGFGGTPQTISALFLVGWYRGNPFFPVHVLKGGNHRITEEMAAAFETGGRRIRYGIPATSITQDGRGVTVTCADGSIHAADQCIVATTAPVARRIVRGLSPAKTAALDAVEYVPLTSIGLHVRNFPGPEKLAGALFVNGSTAAYVNQCGPVAGSPREGTVLVVVVTDPAKTGLPERELLAMAGRDLRVVHPGFDLERDLLEHVVKEFKVGEVHVKPGFLSRNLAELRAPAGRVHFGGEIVSCFPTWGGAVWGGHKAAAAVVKAIRKSPVE